MQTEFLRNGIFPRIGSNRFEILALGQATIMKKTKTREDIIFRHFNYQAMITMVINGKSE